MPTPIATSGIAGQAFRLLEMSPISSLGDDSEQAISAAQQYPVALSLCLEQGDFSFASQLAALPPVAEVSGDPDLAYVFMRPSDLVRLQEVWPEDANWRLDADRLRADVQGPLHIRYSRMISDETKLPGLFRTAVAYHLAALLAPRWTTSINRATALAEQGDEWLSRAARADRRSASGRRFDGDPREADWAGRVVL